MPPKPKFSLSGLSLITFFLLGLANLPLRHAAQTGEPGAGGTRLLWVMVDLIRLLQLVAMGVLVFAVVRGIGRFLIKVVR
jgi:hypothetical protein